MIYLLRAIELTLGDCSTVHIYTQTIHRTVLQYTFTQRRYIVQYTFTHKQYIEQHN